MASRTPSRPSAAAIPFPMPRVPPVTSATFCRRDNRPPSEKPASISEAFPSGPLFQPGDNYCHVVGLLGRAAPFLGGRDQGLGQGVRRGMAVAHGQLDKPLAGELLAIDVLRLDQAVAIGQQHTPRFDLHRALVVSAVVEQPDNHAAILQLAYPLTYNAKGRQVARVGVA